MRSRVINARLVGTIDPALRGLLGEVLRDLGVELEAGPRYSGSPDVVLVLVGPRDPARSLAGARLQSGTAPVIAIVPFGDPRIARAVLRGGAVACYALDTPLARLCDLIIQVASDGEDGRGMAR